ncbi:helix-turn-helix domain-containing protein [Nakamurella leprariae]|uniref:Helix-turn-helix transcriptional regulator n=1 Tax=Nakamurella leprariae TaxID=2803911 RepID=A0A938YEF5_9ACTN|nr:AraC family transcriptional regulator [Nakamurella leprariae]MBM9466912.1 helix-turn-helix transcriptional regulator [Nakamurella leprariae]
MKGPVHRTEASPFRLGRSAVPDALAPFAEHGWTVDWSLDPAGPAHPSAVIPAPSVHVTVERGEPGEVRHGHPLPATLVHGVVTRMFSVELAGAGSVVGVRFRAGGFAAFCGRDVDDLTDRVLPARSLLGPAVPDDGAELATWLADRAPEPPPVLAELTALLDAVAADPTVVRVEQLAALAGWSVRGTQRVFRAMVGVSPKWVITRLRLLEAAHRLELEPELNVAELAVQLGWYDQAHLTRDFRRLLGRPPGRYAREGELAQARAACPDPASISRIRRRAAAPAPTPDRRGTGW